MKRILTLILFALMVLANFDVAVAGEPVLNPPPLMPEISETAGQAISSSPQSLSFDTSFRIFLPLVFNPVVEGSVDVQSKASVTDYFNTFYLNQSVSTDWNGNLATCNYGSTSAAFRESVMRRINYYRVMAGIPPLNNLYDVYNQKAQAAAALMSINDALNHTPPSSWTCYSQLAYDGASSSNLALGAYGLGAISLYMQDPGDGNGAVGHRRWILYPQTQEMGSGDIPSHDGYWSSNALVVFDSHLWEPRPETRDGFVAWPPAGYVPYQVVYPRWSFSYPGADFSTASVSMIKNGQSVSSIKLETVVNGYGENTLVWIPFGLSPWQSWPVPSADEVYQVTISQVKINGVNQTFQYQVTIFSP